MRKVSLIEAKRNLSALIDGFKRGSPVLIVDRGRPVARLEPVAGRGAAPQSDRLSRLARDGVVQPGSARLCETLFDSEPPRAGVGVSAVDTLILERREGR